MGLIFWGAVPVLRNGISKLSLSWFGWFCGTAQFAEPR